MDRSEYDDDQLLVRFLLGELPDDDAGELEQAVLTDGGLFEKLRRIEDDLVDAYVRGELEARQARSFERRFLATAEGRSRVASTGARRPRPTARVPGDVSADSWRRRQSLVGPGPRSWCSPSAWPGSGVTSFPAIRPFAPRSSPTRSASKRSPTTRSPSCCPESGIR